MNFSKRISNYISASFPCVFISTSEETRAQADIFKAAKALDREIFTWSATEGIKSLNPVRIIDDTAELTPACNAFNEEKSILIMRDVQTWPLDRDPVMNRAFRDLLARAPGLGSTIILIGPSFTPHATVEKLITCLEYTLPDHADLGNIAEGIATSVSRPDLAIGQDVIMALSGLSTTEAENALSLSLVETNAFTPAVIYREKVQGVKKSGLLDIVEADPRGMDAIGGLENLKTWIMRRKRAYLPEAKTFGLSQPKGVLLVGVPGTGKSLAAKCIGTALGVPTIRLDLGSMMNSLVGASEQRMRDALTLCEAMSPCVLWVDEIDKGLAGSGGSGSGDSGVTRRVFGTLISWMQERKKPVFVIATANQVDALPAELLRKGRFDEIFSLDLPEISERAAIFRIQLIKRKRESLYNDCVTPALLKKTDGFTGSEIESVIDEAMFLAFERGTDLHGDDLAHAASVTVPLVVTAKEQIDGIRKWAKNRARPASAVNTSEATQNARKLL